MIFCLTGMMPGSSIDYENDGEPVATVEVRCILKDEFDSTLTAAADNLPLQPHVSPAPGGIRIQPEILRGQALRHYGNFSQREYPAAGGCI